MRRRNAAIAVVTLSISAFLAGRGWWKPADQEEAPQDLVEVLLPEQEPAQPVREVLTAKPTTREPRLRVGDDFPFVRTIEQTVTQQVPAGAVTSSSSLELVMGLRVEEIRDGSKRLRVHYHRVRYAQDIAGERLNFDSDTAQAPVPVPARAYHGLVNNGFDLWIGVDNRPAKLDGFELFLKRCVRDIPSEERQAFSTALVGMSQDDSIASFIDESIGLLPYIAASNGEPAVLHVGTQWEQQRHIELPYPLELTNACTLTAVDEHSAKIEIVGEIHPSPGWSATESRDKSANVVVRSGRALGHCIIDRGNGFPLESRMERTLDMVVTLPDGASIPQQKLVLTTIRSLPSEGSRDAIAAPATTAVQGAPSPPEDEITKASYEKDVAPTAVDP